MFVVGGESLIDLVSKPKTPDGEIFLQAHQGGSPYNCAIALARLGNPAGFLCPISRDGFGDYLMEPLKAAGVDVLLNERVREPSTLAVVTLDERGAANYEFYRGAERALDLQELLAALPTDLGLYQIGGFCPIEAADAEIWLQIAGEAQKRGAFISMDPNVRPSLVDDFPAYRQRLSQFFDMANLIKLSVEDLHELDPELDVEAHAKALLARPQCKMVIVTDGENGSRAFTENAHANWGIYRTEKFGDTVGAGDNLMAGVLTILGEQDNLDPQRLERLDEAGIEQVLRFGAVVAGLNCAEKGSHPPTRSRVDAVLRNL